MFDIIGLGELLIDFTPSGKSANGNDIFEANPGGGVANFTVAAAKLGAKTAFMGKVGQDMFGRQLAQTMHDYGVNTDALVLTEEFMTTVAFVKLYANGERDFSFYRKNGADAMISVKDINCKMLTQTKALHFSSLTLVNETCYAATEKAAEAAKKAGAIITYDPNWRPNLWEDAEYCRFAMGKGMYWADIVKVSEEELEYITGLKDPELAVNNLMDRGPRLIIVTLGSKGLMYYCKNGNGEIAGFEVKAIDATGAGDTCFGATIFGIINQQIDLDNIDIVKLENLLTFANAAAALSVTKRGGMPSLPSTQEVLAMLEERGK